MAIFLVTVEANSFVADFKALKDSSSFISKNSDEISKKYAKKFVAIKGSEIVAFGDNFENVLKEVKEKGLDPSLTLIGYVPGGEEIILY